MGEPISELRKWAEELPPLQPRACNTCANRGKYEGAYARCGATGAYIDFERRYNHGPCGPEGRLWTQKPPRVLGVFEKVWRFLFGERG